MPRTVKLSLFVLTLFVTVFAPIGVGQIPDFDHPGLCPGINQLRFAIETKRVTCCQKNLVTSELAKELVKQGNFLLLAGKYSVAFDVYTLAGSVSTQIKDTRRRRRGPRVVMVHCRESCLDVESMAGAVSGADAVYGRLPCRGESQGRCQIFNPIT